MLELIQLFPVLLLGAIIVLTLILVPLIRAEARQHVEPPTDQGRPQPLLPRAKLSVETQPLRVGHHTETQPIRLRAER